jgi:hypothetical protein
MIRLLPTSTLALASLLVIAGASYPARADYYAPGTWQATAWTPGGDDSRLYDDGTNGDVAAGDGVYSRQVTIATPGSYQWKVSLDVWADSWPKGVVNSWFRTTGPNETVTFTFDTNSYNDGWLPSQNIPFARTQSPPVTTLAIVGELQSEMGCAGDWDPACMSTEMNDAGVNGDVVAFDGIWSFLGSVTTAGTYQYKATADDGWDHQYGAEGPATDGGTTYLSLTAGQQVLFRVNTNTGRISPAATTTSRAVTVTFQMCLPESVSTTGTVCVIGNQEPLGAWSTGVNMNQPCPDTSPKTYSVDVTFPSGSPTLVEYKYKKDDCGTWEDAISNRQLVLSDASPTQVVPLDVWNNDLSGCSGCLAPVKPTSWGAIKALYH